MSTAEAVVRLVGAVVIGLLLGSVLPAELLARRHGVDIHAVGDGNPGTVNAFRGVGWVAGVITLLYDLLVGVVSILIARLLGMSDAVGYLAGIMALVGHRFPVFSGFRQGGQGMAASAGMLLYGVGIALSRGWLSIADLAVVVALGVIVIAFTRSATMVALTILPVLVIEVFFGHLDWPFVAFMTVVVGHIWIAQVAAARRLGLLRRRGIGPASGQTRC